MITLMQDPQVALAVGLAIAGFIGGITGLIAALANYLHTNSKIRQERAATENRERQVEVDTRLVEAQHRRELEALRTKMDLEASTIARATEQRLENKVEALLEARMAQMQADLISIKESRTQIRNALAVERRAREELGESFKREKNLREQLEQDFQALKAKFDKLTHDKAQVETERNMLRGENAKLQEQLDRMQLELTDTQKTLVELERQFQIFEGRMPKESGEETNA